MSINEKIFQMVLGDKVNFGKKSSVFVYFGGGGFKSAFFHFIGLIKGYFVKNW